MARVLIAGDMHEPATHPGYLQFCKDLYKKWNCNKVVMIGDIIDWHAISFWPKEPNCPGPIDEYKLAKERVNLWHKAFPRALVCIGNHDERPERLAKSVNIPALFLKDYNALWETKGWTWDHQYIIDNVLYFHGTGYGGIHPAWTAINGKLMSVVLGHCHARSGIKWLATPTQRIFGMDVGSGIDVAAYQFVYGKHLKYRPILSAGVVINGQPYHEIMPISAGEKYDKRKFKTTTIC